MSSPDSPSLEINRHRSLEIAVIATSLFVFVGVPFAMMWLIATFTFIDFVLLSGAASAIAIFYYRQTGWLGGPRSVVKAQWDSEGQWWLFDAHGARWPATLRHGSSLLGNLIWLRFQSTKGSRQLLLQMASDRRDREGEVKLADSMRRLRVRLRFESAVNAREADQQSNAIDELVQRSRLASAD